MGYFSGTVFKSVLAAAVFALGIGFSAAVAEGKDATDDTALVIVDKAILKQSGLTFKSTLKHILRGDRPVEDVTDGDAEDFLQTLLDSFAERNFPGMQTSMPLATLQPQDLLDDRDADEGGSP